MVMPKRPAKFVPGARSQRQRQSAQQRGHGGHQDRAEAQHARFKNRLDVLFPSSRSACSAKSIIMMAFFFTMPISSTMPMMEMMFRSSLKSIKRQHRAHARRRQGRNDRQRMHQALVQNAEHDVHRQQRRHNQHGSVPSDCW